MTGIRLVLDRSSRRRRYYRDCDEDYGLLQEDDLLALLSKRDKERKEKKEKEKPPVSISFGTAMLTMACLWPFLLFGTAYGGAWTLVQIYEMVQHVVH